MRRDPWPNTETASLRHVPRHWLPGHNGGAGQGDIAQGGVQFRVFIHGNLDRHFVSPSLLAIFV